MWDANAGNDGEKLLTMVMRNEGDEEMLLNDGRLQV